MWLLNKVNNITAGVNTKANPVITLNEHMVAFFTMIQGRKAADDENLNTFNSRLQNMEMDGGAHLLCRPQPMEKTLNDSYEDDDIV